MTFDSQSRSNSPMSESSAYNDQNIGPFKFALQQILDQSVRDMDEAISRLELGTHTTRSFSRSSSATTSSTDTFNSDPNANPTIVLLQNLEKMSYEIAQESTRRGEEIERRREVGDDSGAWGESDDEAKDEQHEKENVIPPIKGPVVVIQPASPVKTRLNERNPPSHMFSEIYRHFRGPSRTVEPDTDDTDAEDNSSEGSFASFKEYSTAAERLRHFLTIRNGISSREDRPVLKKPKISLSQRQALRVQNIVSEAIGLPAPGSVVEGPLPWGWQRRSISTSVHSFYNIVTRSGTQHMPGTPSLQDAYLGSDTSGFLPFGIEYVDNSNGDSYYYDHIGKVRMMHRLPSPGSADLKVLQRRVEGVNKWVDEAGMDLPYGWHRRLGRFGISFYIYENRVIALGSPCRRKDIDKQLMKWTELPEL